MTLDYIQLDTDTPPPPATRELQVGCIRTSQVSPKKVTTAPPGPSQPLHSSPGLGPSQPWPSVDVGWAGQG